MTDEVLEKRKKTILEMINSPNYIPMKLKEMAIVLRVPDSDRAEFEQLLNGLVEEGKITKSKKGKYSSLASSNMVVGTFRSNSKGYGFLVLDDEGEEDLFIPRTGVNGAIHMDRVLCKVHKSAIANKKKEAEVIKILNKESEVIIGTYHGQKEGYGFVVPDSNKIISDIFIPKRLSKGAVDGHKVVVKVVKREADGKSPEGEIVNIIGHINDPGVDILSVIYQYGLPMEFPPEVMDEVSHVPDEVDPRDKGGRLDLRSVPMVTIDGEDAKDLDDAVSLSILPNGNYELGVHIADVSHYVKEKTPLDKEAFERGTSVYLVDRVIPMLPHRLSNGLCSLNAHVDRLALSCIMEIDCQGNVLNHNIAESVVKIDERMTYNNVNKILNDEDPEVIDRYKDFVPMFKEMEKLSKILRARRQRRGAIDFDFPEVKVILDDEGSVVDLKLRERNAATKLIEDFMLICNETVAEDYFWQEVPFVYRSHETPDPDKITELATFISNFGYQLKKDPTKVHPKDMQKVMDQIKDKPEESIISQLLLRSMRQARYTPDCNGHFGLAAKYYCHFTSPIRRYPDLQIHRIIKYNLHHKLKGKTLKNLEERMPEVSQQCSNRERRADEAERETIKAKKAEYMEDYIGERFTGVISGVTNWGIYVELPNTIEGLVHIDDMYDDDYYYNEGAHKLVGSLLGREYQLGDQIDVIVSRVDKITRSINFIIDDQMSFLAKRMADGALPGKRGKGGKNSGRGKGTTNIKGNKLKKSYEKTLKAPAKKDATKKDITKKDATSQPQAEQQVKEITEGAKKKKKGVATKAAKKAKRKTKEIIKTLATDLPADIANEIARSEAKLSAKAKAKKKAKKKAQAKRAVERKNLGDTPKKKNKVYIEDLL